MRRLAAACAALAVLATGCASGNPEPQPSELRAGNADSIYRGVEMTPPRPRPQFKLKDTSGKQFRFGSDTAGRPTLLFFGFTNCPDVCPTTLADIMNALREVPASVRDATRVVFVTTDVKRDTGPVIARYLRNFDRGLPPFIGLYGTQAEIDAAQVAAGVVLAEDGGQTHSAQVLLYGPDDYARVSFIQSNNEGDQIAHDLPLIAGKS